MKENFNNENEAEQKEVMFRAEKELLEAAGLSESDMRLLHDFRAHGFSAFVHGSLIKSQLRNISDIDFVLVGDLDHIPSSLRNEFIPDITDEQLEIIDYFSVGKVSDGGRKMSLHIEKEAFREQYPNNQKPYAREYRPAKNLKEFGINRYLLCGLNGEGISSVFRVECPQEQLSHGVVNTIPQTGLFLLEESFMSPQNDRSINMPITHIASGSSTHSGPISVKPSEGAMVFGLEFDKMRTDRVLYPGDTDKFVKLPIERTLLLANEFLGKDSRQYIDEGFALLEKYWSVRKG